MSLIRISILLLFIILFAFLHYVNSANILGFFFYPSISHQIIFQPIWRELSLRGHQVTVVTPNPLNDPELVNLTEIDVHFTYDLSTGYRIDQIMLKDLGIIKSISTFYERLEVVLIDEFESQHVQQFLSDKNRTFDLILIQAYHPLLYGLAGRYKAPIISVSSLDTSINEHYAVGNPVHPVLNPNLFLFHHGGQMSLYDKLRSVFCNIYMKYYFNYVIIPKFDKIARTYFGDNIPYLGDLFNNVSLLFVNVNPLLHPIRANVPAIIEMRQMHIKPPKPLPQDLKKILDEAREGFIYFSLGSNVKSVNLPETLRKYIIEALSELPYKILWKWESDHLPDQPANVITRKWLPQQDILAHPNIKVFVTQGGLQSIEEAINRGVPMVVMPFMSDQTMNAQRIHNLGIAISLNPTSITKNELKDAIITIAEDNIYKNRILEVRDLLLDEPMTGLEKVIWWSEYVIRHKGARHLRSPAIDMPWYYYHLLDVIATIILILLIFLYVLYLIIKHFAFQLTRKFKND